MTCPELTPSSPPLSYCVASFTKADYDRPDTIVQAILAAGFKVLTLIPTFHARTQPPDSPGLRKFVAINAGDTPSFAAIRDLAIAGIKAGMHVRFEPHIDAEHHYWRANLVFDPAAVPPAYYEKVLRPIFDVIVAIKDTPVAGLPACKPCFSLTLGAELEASLAGFPAGWETALTRLKRLRAGAKLNDRLAFGHNLNWDHFAPKVLNQWVAHVNSHNKAVGHGRTDLSARTQAGAIKSYLSKLDYVGVSFYPPLAGNLGKGLTIQKTKWQHTPTTDSVKAMADVMEHQWGRYLAPLAKLGPAVEICEAGVGSSDATHPNAYKNWESMRTDAGRNVAQHLVRGLAQFVRAHRERFRDRSKTACLAYRPATFWTVGQYDWLGRNPKWHDFRVNALAEWIGTYNRQTFSPD